LSRSSSRGCREFAHRDGKVVTKHRHYGKQIEWVSECVPRAALAAVETRPSSEAEKHTAFAIVEKKKNEEGTSVRGAGLAGTSQAEQEKVQAPQSAGGGKRGGCLAVVVRYEGSEKKPPPRL